MIELRDLTKRYGDTTAVNAVNAVVRPGVVTGFLGPNGAGKSTTMRAIVGLDRPTSGVALVNGRSYVTAPAPLAEVGALLDAKGVDKGRSARNHLLALGATVGIGARRVDEVLGTVGLTDVAGKAAGTFSLGMGQRLGIAAALLADPGVLILDEPVNGLDLDGIQWIRALLGELAAEGRTVLLSSHLMSEMELVAEHLLVIGQGRILADTAMDTFIATSSPGVVQVTSPDASTLAALLVGPDVVVASARAGQLDVRGVPADVIGDLAAVHGLRIHGLVTATTSLETAYLELTRDAVEYTGTVQHHPRPTPSPTDTARRAA
jgi:ABC-2 type transport system ATP-binding protein